MTASTTSTHDLPAAVEAPAVPASTSRRGWLIGAAVAAATFGLGLTVPFITSDPFIMSLALDAVILALLALSLGFLARHLGLISLGHTAFFGGSAYMVAMTTTHWDWGPMRAAAVAVLAATLLAVLFGALVVRASGMGFLMLTLALGQALYSLTVQTSSRPVTGAFDGLQVSYPADARFLGLTRAEVGDPGLFWPVAWSCLVLAAVALWVVGRSRFGTTLEGIRENEERMRFSGYGTFVPRLIAFVISGAVAAVGGALFALNSRFVSPELLGFATAGDSLIAAIVGGLGTLVGPVVGAALYIYAQSEFNDSGNLHLYTGLALILVLMFLPGGITGGLQRLWRRLPIGARRGGGR
ncbi:MAG: hypothetical protein JWN88_623 [Frankiales bacterium]|jgi:branched-chain amino acid transport system permease protein|nr:hypothetical protein [Frankiales bacterium]